MCIENVISAVISDYKQHMEGNFKIRITHTRFEDLHY